MNLFKKLKNKKGLTGSDVAASITLIVLTVGIVTSIYVNAIRKSKNNMRYANATRIATSIMENIQKQPFEYLTAICYNNDTYEVETGNEKKVFGTKIPIGYRVKITAKKVDDADYDIARDVIINVTYKASTTHKTITLTSVKQKELMDMTNAPDFSLIPNYNPSDTQTYYYPVIFDGTNYMVTTTSDINWYNYEEGKYALVYKTTSGAVNVGTTGPIDNIINDVYVWIPRFVEKSGSGIDNVQFLYGASDYIISFNQYANLYAYGLSYSEGIDFKSTPDEFDSNTFYYSAFDFEDGLSGVWYQIGGTNSDKPGINNNKTIKEIATSLNSKIECENATIN